MTARVHSLDAVARVRRVREQDSRTGFQLASREVEEAELRLATLDAQLDAQDAAGSVPSGDFVARRGALLAVAQARTAAQGALVSSRNLAGSALAHWQHDAGRLKAIEMLQERRAAEVRAEAVRAEAKELDDIATQLWQRRNRPEVVS